ncbi:FAD:protein FMN transferase [Cytobacillus sp. Hz8]|uniref:FAD:protein FMN transferase n=1 Tax=Cytobacillus sp. Hz8 TaxID=3347168 RepID=UPI0035E27BE9
MIEIQEGLKGNDLDSIQLRIMNTTFFIGISNSQHNDWKNEVTSFLQYIERSFSRFESQNELWWFNQANKDEVIQVSPVLYDILLKAEEYRRKTEGRFSPFLLNHMEAHGYNRSFPFIAASEEVPYKKKEPLENEPLQFYDRYYIKKNTNQPIDLGGIAKGYAVEATAKWLKENAKSRYGIVDGGGDMSVWSNGEKTWKIGIMNPFHEEEQLGSFQIENGGIATSNIIYRSWWQGKNKKHHLLDGRTGNPVDSSIVQATVIMDHCLDAEIGAKICFMKDQMPIQSVLATLDKPFQYCVVHSDGQLEQE